MQTTLNQPFSLVGTGLHSGRPVRLTVRPANSDTGIVFNRVDIPNGGAVIPARFDTVNDTKLCTRIANPNGVEVSTVEHLMAAFAGCGVHNAIVELDGPEVPIMDGSSDRFVQEILTAGVITLNAPVKILRVLRQVSVSENGAYASIVPSDEFEIDFQIEYNDSAIGVQHQILNMKNGSFVRELSNCRTFCLQSDVEDMEAAGLALGGSLDNAVVVDNGEILNPEGFRRDDECVRHKMLDVLGDLALAGMPIVGRYRGIKAGHRMTNLLLRKLFATPDAYEIVTADAAQVARLPGTSLSFEDLGIAV